MSLTPAAAETLRNALAAVVVVPVTPMRADGSPDWDTYATLTGRLLDGGITVITPNGNTGEFYALSQAEARQAVQTAVRLAESSADNVSVVKEALSQLGLCGADVRPPSRRLPRDIRNEITAILASWGLR